MNKTKSVLLFLIPNVVRMIVGFALLKLTTLILDASDYGLYALIDNFVLLLSSTATLGVSLFIPAIYPEANQDERTRLISTNLWIGVFVYCLLVGLLLIVWPIILNLLQVNVVPSLYLLLSFGGGLIYFPWLVSHQPFILEKRVVTFVTLSLIEIIIWNTTLLLALFIFDLAALSLYLSRFLGMALLGIGTLFAMRVYIRPVIDSGYIKRLFKTSLVSTGGIVLERGYRTVENTLLTRFAGLGLVGIYNHSILYRTAILNVTNAFANTLWPITLEEARTESKTFSQTRQGWNIVYFGVTLSALAMLVVAEPIIDWLTNGEFTRAASIIPLWMCLILIQTSARDVNGILYANDRGAYLSIMASLCTILGIIAAVILIPIFSVYGAIIALVLNQMTYRIIMNISGWKRLRFTDNQVVFQICIILVAVVLSEVFAAGSLQKVLIAVGASIVAILLNIHTIQNIFSILNAMLVGKLAKSP